MTNRKQRKTEVVKSIYSIYDTNGQLIVPEVEWSTLEAVWGNGFIRSKTLQISIFTITDDVDEVITGVFSCYFSEDEWEEFGEDPTLMFQNLLKAKHRMSTRDREILHLIHTLWTKREEIGDKELVVVTKNSLEDMKRKGFVVSILEEPSEEPSSGYYSVDTFVMFEFPPKALKTVKGRSTIISRELIDTRKQSIIDVLSPKMAQVKSKPCVIPWTHIGAGLKGTYYLFQEEGKPVGCVYIVYGDMLYDDNDDIYYDDNFLKVYFSYLSSLSVLPSIVELVKELSSDSSEVRCITDPRFSIPIPPFLELTQLPLLSTHSKEMMMRIIDFEKYCRAIRVPEKCDEQVIIELVDDQCPWNQGIFRLRAEKGNLLVDRLDDSVAIDIQFNPFTLSSVIYGKLRPADLKRINRIDCSEETAFKLDRIFPSWQLPS